LVVEGLQELLVQLAGEVVVGQPVARVAERQLETPEVRFVTNLKAVKAVVQQLAVEAEEEPQPVVLSVVVVPLVMASTVVSLV